MNTIFDTTDIVLAAYLVTQKHTLSMVTMRGNKGTFVFNGIDPAVITEFDLGNARAEPMELNTAIKRLTTMCRRNQGEK